MLLLIHFSYKVISGCGVSPYDSRFYTIIRSDITSSLM